MSTRIIDVNHLERYYTPEIISDEKQDEKDKCLCYWDTMNFISTMNKSLVYSLKNNK